MSEMVTCPQCGCQIYRVIERGLVHPVNMETLKIDFDATPHEHFSQYYQCKNCRYKLLDDNDNLIDDHMKFVEWFKNNQI